MTLIGVNTINLVNMKKVVAVICCFCLVASSAWAQDEEETQKGFKKQNLFTGGSVTISFFNGQTVLGANPIFGYKLAKWVDAGIAFNFMYASQRYYYQYDDKIKQTVYGPGIFTRLYPVSFLFAQAQLEHNFTSFKYYAAPGSTMYMSGKINTSANSLLLGAGFAQGRVEGSNSFYYICVLFDVLKDINSPYVYVTTNPNNSTQQHATATPIIRAGFNIALFQKR